MLRYEIERGSAAAIAIAAATAGLVLAVGLILLFASSGGSEDNGGAMGAQDPDTDQALPGYVLAGGDEMVLAYQFALDRPDVMLWMPCYCGCGGHSGHRNARDCFVKATSSSGSVQFEEHGSACDVCVNIALKARELTLAGRPLSETRAAVDQEFGDIGPGTDTPLPPG
jgi:hypothetical protein